MAVPASTEALRLGGNLAFGAGGMSVDFLTGAFVKSAEVNGTTLTLTVQTTAGLETTVDFTASGTSTGLNLEQVQDAVAAMLTEGSNITLTYDDADGTLTIVAADGGGGATITDADIDVDDPSNESTTAGASRQAIAEAIQDQGGGLRHPTATYDAGATRITLTEAANDAIAVGDLATFQIPPGVAGSDEIVIRIGTGASQAIVDLAGAAVEAQQFTVASRVVLLRRTLNWIVLVPDVNASDSDNPWRGAWSATARYSDGDIFTHHDVQWLVHGGQDNVLIPVPIQYQERRDDIQIIGTHWVGLKTSINSDQVSTITSYFSIGQRWIFADERAFLCVETGNYLHSDIPSSSGWKEIGAGGTVSVDPITMEGDGSADDVLTVKPIAGHGGPPQASAAYEGRTFVDLDSLDQLVCTNTPHTTSEATGSFTEITSVTILPDYASRPTPTLDAYYYVPDQNQFLVGTQLGPGIIGYVQDSAGDALENDRESGISLIYWIGRLDTDEEAAEDIQTLVANTNYFYYNRQLQQIRRLTRSSFTPAGGTVDHYNWAPPKADDYKDRVLRVQGGRLPAIPVDGTGDDWIRISDDGMYIVDIENHPATVPTADSWATFSDGTDYQGVAADDGDIAIAGTQYYFNSRHFTFRDTYIDTSLAVRYRDRTPPDGYIGHFDSRQDALNHAAARGIEEDDEFTAFTGSLVEEATNFTPADSFETTRDWVFIPVDAEGGGASGDLGETTELYSNMDTAGVRINVESGFGNTAANGGEFEFSRALVEADDNDILLIDIEYTTGPTSTRVTHYVNHFISARSFRERDAVAVGASNSDHTESVYVHRFGNSPALTGWAEGRFIFARGRNTTSGNDILRLAAGANSTSPDLTGVKVRVLLESVGGAAASEAEGDTSGAGFRRVTRRVAGASVSIAITDPNALNFTDGSGVATGQSVNTFDPVPLDGLIGFSATIQVAGRAGHIINLTKEQIIYVGPNDLPGWGFTQLNGYSGGSLLPAACLFLQHQSLGPSFVWLRPQRQQVRWGTTASVEHTALLFTFGYDDDGDNIIAIRIIALTTQPCEIEHIDLYYEEEIT